MDFSSTVGLTLLGGAVTAGFVRGFRRASDQRRRESDRAAWEDRKRQEAAAKTADAIARSFPHARDALRAELRHGRTLEDAAFRALDSVEGVLLGEATVRVSGQTLNVPARWPTAERRK